jgi:hypothetical protein
LITKEQRDAIETIKKDIDQENSQTKITLEKSNLDNLIKMFK